MWVSSPIVDSMTETATSTALAIIEPSATAWDAFAQAHPDGTLLQSSAWGTLKSGFGWRVRRLAVIGPGGMLAGAQALVRRRFGLAGVYVPRGPLFSGDQQADAALIAALDRVARRARAVVLRCEPPLLENDARADALHSFLLLQGFHTVEPAQPHSSVHLDLEPPPERLLTAVRKGHRADIRRAAREGVAVRRGGPDDLDTFYRILQETSGRAGFGIHARAYYTAALRALGAAGALWLAERGGAAEAAALTAAWGRTALYLYSGSTEAGLRSGAQHAIQWQAIQWARERGCAIYDFWGIPDAFGQAAAETDERARARLLAAADADPLAGVYRFKKGFGGRIVRYLPAYDRPYIQPLYALWRRRM
jgi:lipid II:glycine glycyltransferase (peptidoglycan interpeptide bridge formation enzyme)